MGGFARRCHANTASNFPKVRVPVTSSCVSYSHGVAGYRSQASYVTSQLTRTPFNILRQYALALATVGVLDGTANQEIPAHDPSKSLTHPPSEGTPNSI